MSDKPNLAALKAALSRMESYPVGVPTGAWGTGPMSVMTSTNSYLPPDSFNLDELREHG